MNIRHRISAFLHGIANAVADDRTCDTCGVALIELHKPVTTYNATYTHQCPKCDAQFGEKIE